MARIIEQRQVAPGTLYTRYSDGVAVGLRKTDYIKGRDGHGGRVSAPIQTDDPKYDMYANALPAAIRQKVCAAGLDVRALYKEYRATGRDAMVAKYGNLGE